MSRFYKLSGGGNDFLALVEPKLEPSPEEVAAWCRRRVSLGADGLFTLARRTGGARMIHYNADGTRAELCVNGTRCAAQLAFHLGWQEGSTTIRTDSGEISAAARGSAAVEIALTPPGDAPRAATLDVGEEAVAGFRQRVGGPHFVIAWERALDDAPVARLGPSLRAHAALGPDGANVHWVDYSAPDRFAIRSFERGVEAETLACGSGVLAATAVGVAAGRLELPATARTAGGFSFRVGGRVEGGSIREWALTGDARLVAQGELLDGASAAIEAPPATG